MISWSRVGVVAANVFREVIRDRILYIIALFAVGFALANVLIPYVAAGTENQILLDLGLAAIGVLGLVVAIFVGTGLINREIDKRTIYVLAAKPLSRAELILGKQVGLSLVLAVLLLAMTAIYMLVLTSQQVPYPIDSIGIAVLFQFLKLCLITAVALLFGVMTSSLLATLLTFAVYLMGHFSQDLLKLTETATDPNIRRVMQGAYLVLPDLSRFNLKNQAVYGLQLLPDALKLAENAVYGLLYTVVVLAIAILIFSRREF
jgi:ABC-type transport system involved in multi-copper enzyme maturation permease subunit